MVDTMSMVEWIRSMIDESGDSPDGARVAHCSSEDDRVILTLVTHAGEEVDWIILAVPHD